MGEYSEAKNFHMSIRAGKAQVAHKVEEESKEVF
jgi:hypothetical protein